MPDRGASGSGVRQIRWSRTSDGVSLAFGGCEIVEGQDAYLDEGTAERAVVGGLAEYVDVVVATETGKRRKAAPVKE